MVCLCFAFFLLVSFAGAAYAQAAPTTGLLLVGNFPLEAEIVQDFSDEQGNYAQELLVLDGAATLMTLRQNVDDAHPIEMPILDFLSVYFEEIREVESIETNPVAAYPTERVRFETGHEEDTAVIDAVLIRTDASYFAFWANTQIDIYYGYMDPFAEGEIPELIDMWVESLSLFDSEDSGDIEPSEDDNVLAEEDDDLAYWNGLDFGPNLEYAEEYVSPGDPGDYLNHAEAAKLVFDTMKDKGNIPEYSDDTQYTLILVGEEDVNGEGCYVYRLETNDSEGTIGAAYAYAYQTGNIYMQGQGGQWVQP